MDIIEFKKKIAAIYKIANELGHEFNISKCTPDGHLLGAIGQIAAKIAFDLQFGSHDLPQFFVPPLKLEFRLVKIIYILLTFNLQFRNHGKIRTPYTCIVNLYRQHICACRPGYMQRRAVIGNKQLAAAEERGKLAERRLAGKVCDIALDRFSELIGER